MAAPRHVVVMGVTSTGKTTIGEAVAERLGGVFVEGDSYHPRANVEKMSAGIPLDDDDRRPWLRALADRIRELDEQGEVSVTGCSALKRMYRDWLRESGADIFFLHLHGDQDVLLERMEKREHFMPPSLLQSQFDTLEMLEEDEQGALVDVGGTVEEVVEESMRVIRADD
ncbi:gluconokinase [Ornithinimicrobium sp. CNJ-824]|uniref:gluconokinase n=1 Tax=Ornithinimicrobium sp. CNJ-824 TaxID=1904966 RepID=UPI000A8F39A8|nr:gluconokinase [Ornithinimicrobium sp. CNJ-824]